VGWDSTFLIPVISFRIGVHDLTRFQETGSAMSSLAYQRIFFFHFLVDFDEVFFSLTGLKRN